MSLGEDVETEDIKDSKEDGSENRAGSGDSSAFDLKAFEAEELKKKQESERKKAEEQDKRDAENAKRDAEIAAKGKRAGRCAQV